MDYLAAERAEQHMLLKAGIVEHVRLHPQSLIIIEEYDKLDCPTRGLLRQLVGSPHSTNVSINRKGNGPQSVVAIPVCYICAGVCLLV